MESLFVHVTVVPTDTVTGFGEYAVVVNVLAPWTILTAAAPPVEGVVGVEDPPPPQDATSTAAASRNPSRREIVMSWWEQRVCLMTRSDFGLKPDRTRHGTYV